MKKSVSDETFSTSYLSSSTVSTPVGMNGRVKKRKRKVDRVIVGDNSVLLSGMLEDARSEFKDTTEEERVSYRDRLWVLNIVHATFYISLR